MLNCMVATCLVLQENDEVLSRIAVAFQVPTSNARVILVRIWCSCYFVLFSF